MAAALPLQTASASDRQQPRVLTPKPQIFEKEPTAAMKATMTVLPMVAVLAAMSAMFDCSELNIGEQ